MAEKIRVDPRVTVLERTNVRYVTPTLLPSSPVDFVTLDLSFISLTKVVPAILDVLSPTGDLVTLIKPQFEAGKDHVEAGGVVKDPLVSLRLR